MERSIKVRLKVDLIEYHPNLRAGIEGYTVGQYGMWSRGSDRFTGVRFPDAGVFDILWESLEIIDEAYLEEVAQREREKREALKSARNVIKVVGPKGGFRYLSYQYSGGSVSTSNRYEAEKLLKLFEEYGIPVKEETAK